MNFRALHGSYYTQLLLFLVKWLVLGTLIGLVVGSVTAFFLVALTQAIDAFTSYPWLLWLLPLGGFAMSWLYMKLGGSAGRGNNLILERLHGAADAVPLRMAPLVLLGTLTTHLFGGSAGREGTAVQMGGSLTEWLGSLLRLTAADRRIMLLCGISSGFGAVFGTPLAGTVFSLEVAAFGLIRYEALLPCFIAAYAGHIVVTELWGVQHGALTIGAVPSPTLLLLGKLLLAAIAFGLAARLFSGLTHRVKLLFTRLIHHPAWRSFAGGVMLIALVYVTGTRDYLGLGLPLIERAFEAPESPVAFLMKILFTAVTLGSGYYGGEVTPLFVIGSTLGSALADLLGLSVPLLAAIGFVAVFGSAANSPLAAFIMGIELFGAETALYLFICCVISYLVSGHSGIYLSQRIGVPKHPRLQIAEHETIETFQQRIRK